MYVPGSLWNILCEIYTNKIKQILGLADCTGELMRYAIYVVSTGKYDQAMVICKLLRKIDLG